MRQTRAAMLESLSADYVRTARAKGLAEREVVGSARAAQQPDHRRHRDRARSSGTLISGAVVTEQVFVLPGFGKLTIDAVFQRDYPVIQGVVLVTTLGYVVINLLVDLLYSVLNPRIRVGGDGRHERRRRSPSPRPRAPRAERRGCCAGASRARPLAVGRAGRRGRCSSWSASSRR